MNRELDCLFEAWDRERLDDAGRSRLNAALEGADGRRAWFEHLHFTGACYELLREAPVPAPALPAEDAAEPPFVQATPHEPHGPAGWMAAAALVGLATGLLYLLLGRPALPGTAREQAPVRHAVGGENEKPAPERAPEESKPVDLDVLLAGLADADAEKREAASRALIALGLTARPRLEAELARQQDPDLRARLKEALDLIGIQTSVLTIEGGPQSKFEFRYIHYLLDRAKDEFPTVAVRDSGIVDLGTSHLDVTPERKRSKHSQLPVLDEFGLVILGDVDPNIALGQHGQDELKRFVENGGGLLLIAGQHFSPSAYAKGPLSDLLPVVPGSARLNDPDVPRETHLIVNLQGQNHPLMTLSTDTKENKVAWDAFPKKLWIASVAGAKPKALVLMSESSKAQTPVMVMMRYGKGTVFYLGTEDLWRWRKDGGTAYYETFYRNLFRYLGKHGGSAMSDLKDGTWELYVNRAVEHPVTRNSNDLLDENVYKAVTDGPRYHVILKENCSKVSIASTKEKTIGGTRVKASDSALVYELNGFAGGRFIVRSGAKGLEAELTIYGSGTPIVRSERGSLAPAP